MVIARNSILIKNSLSIIFKTSMVGVWGLKNTGSVTEEKAIISLRLDHFMYFIPFEGKFNVEKSSQTSFFNLIIIFLFFVWNKKNKILYLQNYILKFLRLDNFMYCILSKPHPC